MEKEPTINDTIKELNSKYGDGSVMKLSEKDKEDFEIGFISTNCISLDSLFGCGGLPRGRIIEMWGQESSGKTLMSLYIAAQVQKAGGVVVFVDAECAFNPEWSKTIGVDISELILVQPSTGEEALDVVNQFAKTGLIDLIIVDSVAALVPKAELEGEIEDHQMALQARLMSKGLRMITGSLAKSKTAVIFINQCREDLTIKWGSKVTTPGGKALRYYASVRIEVKKGEAFKDDKERHIGNLVKLCAVKNKVGIPFARAELSLYYDSGIDLVVDYFNIAEQREVIKKSGNTYSYCEIKLGVGKENALKFIKDEANIKVLEQLKKELYGKETKTKTEKGK